MHPVGRGKGSSGAGACRRPTGAPPTVRTRLPGPAQGPWLRDLPLLITALPTHCQLLNSDGQMGRRLSPAGDDGKRGPQGQARSDSKAGQSTKPGKAVGCEVSPAALEAGDPQVALWNQSGGRAGPGAPPTERGHQTSKKRVFTVVPPVSAETKSHGRGSFKKIARVGQEAAHKGRQPCRAERRAHLPEVPALARGRRSPWKAVRLLRAGATVPKPTPLGALEVVRGRDERGRARTPPALSQWETSGKRDPKRSPWFKEITDTPLTVT